MAGQHNGHEQGLSVCLSHGGGLQQDNNFKQLRPLPDVGFRWAEEGSRMPPVVASSASATLASTRSPLGKTCAVKS